MGDHVALRAIEREDLPQLLAWRNTPDLRRFFREPHELGADDQLGWYERIGAQRGRQRDTVMLAIQDRATGALLGACGLCYVNWIDATAELSIYIGAELAYVDSVLAPDACRCLLGHAFDELNLRRLWTEVYRYDTSKLELLEQLGFSLEGTLRQHHFHDGDYHDSLLFGLLRSDQRR